MSREIKFRAWDGHKMRTDFYLMPDGRAWFLIMDGTVHYTGWEVMQYTGLKDKNGREIYEGDIVVASGYTNPVSGETEGSLFVVEYNGPCLMYVEYFASEGGSGSRQYSIHDVIGVADKDDDAKIVGNIYENPELIEP